MDQPSENRKFFLEYHRAMGAGPKTEDLIRQYVSDEKLVQHILYFNQVFPDYKGVIEEIIAEQDRVFVRLRVQGLHQGEIGGIPPTLRQIDTPFAVCYKIENRKITDHWMIADQMELMEQLGLLRKGKTEAPDNSL